MLLSNFQKSWMEMFQYLEWVPSFEHTTCYSDYTRLIPVLCYMLLFVEPHVGDIKHVHGGI